MKCDGCPYCEAGLPCPFWAPAKRLADDIDRRIIEDVTSHSYIDSAGKVQFTAPHSPPTAPGDAHG